MRHSHSGNWEALARIRVFFPEVERYGSMYRQFDNPLMEEYVYKRRTERGTRMFSKEGGIKAPMKMVKEGGALGVLSDQFVWEGVYVPFFGKVTGTTPLPALLRKRTGADMVAIAVRTDSPGHWIADMGNVVDFSNSDGSLAGDTIEVNRSLETLIRKSVLDVFWMHHRWKSIDRFAPQDKKTDGLLENMELQPYRILVAVPRALDEALVTVPLGPCAESRPARHAGERHLPVRAGGGMEGGAGSHPCSAARFPESAPGGAGRG